MRPARWPLATIRKGVLLSCVTVARREGLWVPDAAAIHVAAPRHSGRVRVPPKTSDIQQDALLKLHGYHVIRISYEQIMHRWHEVQAVIMEAVAQELHLAR